MENELQSEIDNIETTHSGYDEYRYDLDTIGHKDVYKRQVQHRSCSVSARKYCIVVSRLL